MQITLADAIVLRNQIAKRIQELIADRNQVAYVTAPKGEKYDAPAQTVDELSGQLDRVRTQYLQLDYLIHQANVQHTIQWKDQLHSIVTAIELAKQMRGEISALKKFATSDKQSYRSDYGSDTMMITHAQFEPSTYKEKTLQISKQVNRLSSLIEAKNHEIKLHFPEATDYLADE
ncbi:hypothetical protein [Marininema halotolerans]|uniref:hypothetical protein n=1 Tax=Marininema halotolerans TaxID=1155944 RepID=UPI000B89FF39|nr:hypothetical protein [Marininema halotolerans]